MFTNPKTITLSRSDAVFLVKLVKSASVPMNDQKRLFELIKKIEDDANQLIPVKDAK